MGNINKEEKIKAYKEKRERKAERYLELAVKNEAHAESRYEAFKSIGDRIPMGQPILVGHHSERGHRADLKRMDNHMRKMSEHLETAKYYEKKAESLENNRDIFADDPELLEKVSDRLNGLIKLREAYKAFNKTWKAEGLEKALENYPGNKDNLKKTIDVYGDFCHRAKKLPSYMLTNLGAKIRRYESKKDWAEKVVTQEPVGFKIGEIEVKFEDGYWKVFFPNIPSEELRSKLKRSPLVLKWSRFQKAWVRKHTESCNDYFLKILKETIS